MQHKIKNKKQLMTPFGGLNFVYDALRRKGVSQLINNQLGYRSPNALYSYSDVVQSLFGLSLSQGSFVSDLEHFKSNFNDQNFSMIPSPDTVEYCCKELKTNNEVVVSDNGVTHEVNFIERMNDGLNLLNTQLGLLVAGAGGYTLDYDNVVIANEKQDARKTYKQYKGYHPVFAFVGRVPVFIENHNGNTPARYLQKESLTRCFDSLDKYGIKIENFRADSASCQSDVVNILLNKCKYFYTRMVNYQYITELYESIVNWEQVEINYQKMEVGSVAFNMPGVDKELRIIVKRVLKEDKNIDKNQGVLFDIKSYSYQGVLTNNFEIPEKQAIEFYNQRGDSEKSNSYLLNDFNLHHLPFMDIDTNTAFMYLMAMCSILFEWLKQVLVINQVKEITQTMRVKSVFYNYIALVTKWTKRAREKILEVFSAKKYFFLRI